jgi:hypothetical protein
LSREDTRRLSRFKYSAQMSNRGVLLSCVQRHRLDSIITEGRTVVCTHELDRCTTCTICATIMHDCGLHKYLARRPRRASTVHLPTMIDRSRIGNNQVDNEVDEMRVRPARSSVPVHRCHARIRYGQMTYHRKANQLRCSFSLQALNGVLQ